MKKVLPIILIILLAPLMIYSQDVLTLEEAIRNALANNYSIRISEKQTEIAKNNVHPGTAGMLPSIDANGSYTYTDNTIDQVFAFNRAGTDTTSQDQDAGQTRDNVENTTRAAIQLNWTLFDGFAMFARYDRFELLEDRSEIQLQMAMENTILDITFAYINALRQLKNLDVAAENLALTRQTSQRAESRREFGQASSLAVLQSQVNINVDSVSILQLRLAYTNFLRQLNFYMGSRQEIDFTLVEDIELLDLPPYRELLANALDNNTSINQAIKNMEISEQDKRIIVSQYYPRLSLGADYSYINSSSEAGFLSKNKSYGYSLSVNAQWNLFNGMQTSIARQNAEIMIDINNITIEQIKAQVEMNLASAYDNYAQLLDILTLEQQNLATAEENYSRTLELYQYGQLSSLELREAQINLLRNRYRINDARYEAKISEIQLLMLSGLLLGSEL